MIPDLLYRGKSANNWVEGYPVVKHNELCLYTQDDEFVKIDESTLCKKINNHYENDVFELLGHKWVLKYEKDIGAYQLTRKDPVIKFTHYLPIARIKDAKHIGNIIDSPDLIT